MGLDISHNAWHASYGTFSYWRTAIARASGLGVQVIYDENDTLKQFPREYPNVDYDAYEDKNYYGKWDKGTEPEDPLFHLYIHSDCEGKIKHKYLKSIIERLEEVYPDLPAPSADYGYRDWRPLTTQLIEGFKRADAAGEKIKFW